MQFRGLKHGASRVESVQDFLIKPLMHLLEISTFSCHRRTYQNYEQPPQSLQNFYFQTFFGIKNQPSLSDFSSTENISLGEQLL